MSIFRLFKRDKCIATTGIDDEIVILSKSYIENILGKIFCLEAEVNELKSHVANNKSSKFRSRKKLKTTDIIMNIINSEDNDLHKHCIFDKLNGTKLLKNKVSKEVFASTISYLVKVGKIRRGEERGFYRKA